MAALGKPLSHSSWCREVAAQMAGAEPGRRRAACWARVALFSVAWVFVCPADGNALPLPDAYGIYAVSGKSLIRMDRRKPPPTLDSKTSFIVFDRFVGKAKTSRRLTARIRIQRVVWVRKEIETVVNRNNKTMVRESPVRTRSRDSVRFEMRPIGKSPEMLQVVSEEPLAPGLYALRVKPRPPLRFVVADSREPGGDAEQAETSNKAGQTTPARKFEEKWAKISGCVDRHVDTRHIDLKNPTMADVKLLGYSAPGRLKKTKAGNYVVQARYKDCSQFDGPAVAGKPEEGRASNDPQMIRKLCKRARRAYNAKQYDKAAALVREILALEGKDERERVCVGM